MATTTTDTPETMQESVEPKVEINSLIESTPGVRGGDLCVAGTRITVRNIVVWHQMGWTPDETVVRNPYLSHDKVYAALAYYYANKAEIDTLYAAWEAEEDLWEEEYIAEQGTSAVVPV